MLRALPILALLLSACRTAPAPPTEEAGAPPARFGESAVPLASAMGKAQSPRVGTTGAATPAGNPSPGTTVPAASPRPFRTIAQQQDAAGDGGLATPDYVDLLRISLASDGSNARVTVKLGARVPNPMPSGEQMFIGVDLYRRAGARESDYQLFATGTSDGWLAYLDTPEGFVTYPGTFGVGGDLLVFTVPWRALGDLRGAEFSSFLDWDRKGAVITATGADATARKRFER